MSRSPSMEPLHPAAQNLTPPPGGLASYPPVERWEDWTEYDPQAWPRRVERRYQLRPHHLLQLRGGLRAPRLRRQETLTIQKFEGNPEHPGSRGRNCAKGPATLNQVEDPERIRYPLKRVGPRGGGQWQRVSWDEVLDDIAARIRKALVEGRAQRGHVPRRAPGPRARLPPADHARLGDRRAQLAHQRLLRVRPRRLRVLERPRPAVARPRQRPVHPAAVLAPRDRPLLQSPRPADHRGEEAGRQDLRDRHPPQQHRVDGRLVAVAVAGDRGGDAPRDVPAHHRRAPLRSRVPAPLGQLGRVPPRGASGQAADLRDLRGASSRRSTRSSRPRSPSRSRASRPRPSKRWRGRRRGPAPRWPPTYGGTRRRGTSAAGRWRGLSSSWSSSSAPWPRRAGTAPSFYNKAIPAPPLMPPPAKVWSELLYPPEYPLAFFEMSFLLPHLLKEGRGRLDTYFTRVYNPVWTNPDGFSWIEMLTDEAQDRSPRLPHPDLERDRVVRRLRAPDGARLRASRPHEPGDARRRGGSASASPCCGSRSRARASASPPPGRRTPPRAWARCGRRTSSGSSSRGGSIPTGRSGSASGSSPRTARARSSPSTTSTAGCSSTRCPGCRRRPRRRA